MAGVIENDETIVHYKEAYELQSDILQWLLEKDWYENGGKYI